MPATDRWYAGYHPLYPLLLLPLALAAPDSPPVFPRDPDPPTSSPSPPPPATTAAGSQSTGITTTTASINLPSRTVVGLGLGFVAAALCVVGMTILVRVVQVHSSVRRARRNGETVSFREMWNRWGGWWGMLFTQDAAWHGRVRVKVRQIARPEMWEVEVKLRDGEGSEEGMKFGKEEFEEQDQPLSAALRGKDKLALAVLVLMPSPPAPSQALPPIASHPKEAESERESDPPSEPTSDPQNPSHHIEADDVDSNPNPSHASYPHFDLDDDDEVQQDLPEIMLGTCIHPSPGLADMELDMDGDEEKEIAQVIDIEVLPRWEPAQRESGNRSPWGWGWTGMGTARPGL